MFLLQAKESHSNEVSSLKSMLENEKVENNKNQENLKQQVRSYLCNFTRFKGVKNLNIIFKKTCILVNLF